MVYTDYVHIIADDIKELHDFCSFLGIKYCWFQNNKKPHYDIPQKKLEDVKNSSALYRTSRELISIINDRSRKAKEKD